MTLFRRFHEFRSSSLWGDDASIWTDHSHATAFNLDTGAITDLSAPTDTNSTAIGSAGDTVAGESFDALEDVLPFAYDLRTGVRTDLQPGEVSAVDGHVAVGDSRGQAAAYNLRSGKVTGLCQLTPSGQSTASAVSGHLAAGYAVTGVPPGPDWIRLQPEYRSHGRSGQPRRSGHGLLGHADHSGRADHRLVRGQRRRPVRGYLDTLTGRIRRINDLHANGARRLRTHSGNRIGLHVQGNIAETIYRIGNPDAASARAG